MAYFIQISKKNTLVWVLEIFFSKIRVAEQFGLRNADVDDIINQWLLTFFCSRTLKQKKNENTRTP